MSICAGVQNVSRPTLSCQEMSQTPPTTLEETAMTLHQMYQGMESDLAETRSVAGASSVEESGIVPAIADVSSHRVRRRSRDANAEGDKFTLLSSGRKWGITNWK